MNVTLHGKIPEGEFTSDYYESAIFKYTLRIPPAAEGYQYALPLLPRQQNPTPPVITAEYAKRQNVSTFCLFLFYIGGNQPDNAKNDRLMDQVDPNAFAANRIHSPDIDSVKPGREFSCHDLFPIQIPKR